MCVVEEHGTKHVLRRLRLKLDHPTRNGATLLHMLTNLPRQISAQQVAQLYWNRWTWEMCQPQYGHPHIFCRDYSPCSLS
jgi:hypothetical protein